MGPRIDFPHPVEALIAISVCFVIDSMIFCSQASKGKNERDEFRLSTIYRR